VVVVPVLVVAAVVLVVVAVVVVGAVVVGSVVVVCALVVGSVVAGGASARAAAAAPLPKRTTVARIAVRFRRAMRRDYRSLSNVLLHRRLSSAPTKLQGTFRNRSQALRGHELALLAREELDGKTVAEMRLANALWRFVELARG
jgi:succinate dehydrogenase/fumarate reductase flavoprotein subunit